MVRSGLQRRLGALALACLTLRALAGPTAFAQARTGELPKLILVPFVAVDGASEKNAARFSTLVQEELRSRADAVELVISPSSRPVAPVVSSSQKKASSEASAALAEGQKALGDLKFEAASTALKKGIELALADPTTTDFSSLGEAHVSLAVAYFRMDQEKLAQAALTNWARLDPDYKLPENRYPPVFQREYDKARKRADKAPRASLTIEGPTGATAWVDGREVGELPATADALAAGTHYVKVEGSRGERFGQVVELKGGPATVKAAFAGSPPAAAPIASAAAPEPKIGARLDSELSSRLATYVKNAGAEYALVGIVHPSGEQLRVSPALYSVRKQGFIALPTYALDAELQLANVEAFKVAEDATRKAAAFGMPSPLPVVLETSSEPARTALRPGSDRPAKDPEAKPFTRATERPDPALTRLPPSEPQVKSGMSPWVWVAIGVGVAAAAGGTYFGVTQASRPVTGTLTFKY